MVTWEFLESGLFTLPLEPFHEEVTLSGFAGSVEAFDGDESSTEGGDRRGHCGAAARSRLSGDVGTAMLPCLRMLRNA